MPRPPKIHYEDVARACVRIIGRGKHPSYDAVYEEVGRLGSKSTIQKHRNTFLEKFQQSGLSMLPASLPEALIPAIEDLWSTALLEASKAYNEHEAAYEKKLSALQDQLREAEEKAAAQDKMLEDRQRELRLAYEAKSKMADEVRDAQSKLRGQEAVTETLRADKDALHRKLADERAEADRRFDLASQDWAAERAVFKDSIDTLKANSKESEEQQLQLTDYWAMQVADARDRVSEIKDLMREEKERFHADLSIERARTAQLSAQNDRLTAEIERLQVRLESVSADYEGITNQLQEKNDAIRSLEASNAELRALQQQQGSEDEGRS